MLLAVLAASVAYTEALVLLQVGVTQHRFNASANTKELSECDGHRSLSKFEDHAAIASMIAAFEKKASKAQIVLDDGNSVCVAQKASSEGGPVKQVTIVDEVEAEICRDNTDHHTDTPNRQFNSKKFAISGTKMTKLSDKRDVITIWPPSGCTEENPCPVVLFFHGCGGFLPYLQFAMYDDSCYNDLHSVLIFPKLINSMTDIEHSESWTADGTEILEKFVMPYWENFRKENAAIIDEDRVTVMGESLGTGMAFQTGLMYPDIFSSIVATGITDGSDCHKADDFDGSLVLPTKGSREATKLKSVIATFAEKEREADDRVKGLLDLISDAGLQDKVSVDFRVYPDMGHIDSILVTQNQWSALYKSIWQGSKDV